MPRKAKPRKQSPVKQATTPNWPPRFSTKGVQLRLTWTLTEPTDSSHTHLHIYPPGEYEERAREIPQAVA